MEIDSEPVTENSLNYKLQILQNPKAKVLDVDINPITPSEHNGKGQKSTHSRLTAALHRL